MTEKYAYKVLTRRTCYNCNGLGHRVKAECPCGMWHQTVPDFNKPLKCTGKCSPADLKLEKLECVCNGLGYFESWEPIDKVVNP